jgi:hypothetical protein
MDGARGSARANGGVISITGTLTGSGRRPKKKTSASVRSAMRSRAENSRRRMRTASEVFAGAALGCSSAAAASSALTPPLGCSAPATEPIQSSACSAPPPTNARSVTSTRSELTVVSRSYTRASAGAASGGSPTARAASRGAKHRTAVNTGATLPSAKVSISRFSIKSGTLAAVSGSWRCWNTLASLAHTSRCTSRSMSGTMRRGHR